GEVGPLAVAGQPPAHARDVLLERGVVVDAHLLLDLRMGLLSQRDLLGLAHEVELALARRRVRRACKRQQSGRGGDRGCRGEMSHEEGRSGPVDAPPLAGGCAMALILSRSGTPMQHVPMARGRYTRGLTWSC